MRSSRYLWFLGLSILCLVAIISFKTPQSVISALAEAHYGATPQQTIQHFWKLMDLRQMDLARNLVIMPEGSGEQKEFTEWEAKLDRSPLLTLQKLEFLNSDPAVEQGIVVRVFWGSPIEEVFDVMYSFNLKETDKGWQIERMRRLDNI